MTGILVINMDYHQEKKPVTSHSSNGVLTRSEQLLWHNVFVFREFWLVTALSVTMWAIKASVVDWIQLYITHQMNRPYSVGIILLYTCIIKYN